jgi:putative Mg2+ transporter-C (MgtC) family protein
MTSELVDIGVRLLLAGLLGSLIGLEREWRQKAAGLRTNILITLGSALYTSLSIQIAGNYDPARVAAQVVTGIGFLGGGAILRTEGNIQGLTTAATIWINGAIGMAAGSGRFLAAIGGTVATLIVLTALVPVERFLERRTPQQ